MSNETKAALKEAEEALSTSRAHQEKLGGNSESKALNGIGYAILALARVLSDK